MPDSTCKAETEKVRSKWYGTSDFIWNWGEKMNLKKLLSLVEDSEDYGVLLVWEPHSKKSGLSTWNKKCFMQHKALLDYTQDIHLLKGKLTFIHLDKFG